MLAVSLRESRRILSCPWRDRAGADRAPRVPLTYRCAIEKKTTVYALALVLFAFRIFSPPVIGATPEWTALSARMLALFVE